MTDEYRDTPFYKDCDLVYSTGMKVKEIDMAQTLDPIDCLNETSEEK
jgi:hypothetical protein